jgi:hypothetical protein
MSNVVPLRRASIARLACTSCGAETDAACNCNVAYAPAAQRAAEAVAANPEKSDRAIAEDIGVGHATVSRARSTVSGETVEKRVGKDGKARRLPKKAEASPLVQHLHKLDPDSRHPVLAPCGTKIGETTAGGMLDAIADGSITLDDSQNRNRPPTDAAKVTYQPNGLPTWYTPDHLGTVPSSPDAHGNVIMPKSYVLKTLAGLTRFFGHQQTRVHFPDADDELVEGIEDARNMLTMWLRDVKDSIKAAKRRPKS